MADWGNFYVIVGSAGAALVGIQFVVITLVAGMRERPTADTLNSFATPTVVHLVGALLISAIMSSPWPSLFPASIALALTGIGGLTYSGLVIHRTRRQTTYEPVWQDWLWYAVLPGTVYAALALAAIFLRAGAHFPLFIVAAASLALLLIGIHNAWDSVMHIVISARRD